MLHAQGCLYENPQKQMGSTMEDLQDTVHKNRYSKSSSGLPPQRHGLYKFVEFHMRHSVICLCYSCSNHYVLKEKQATHYCMYALQNLLQF